MDAITVDGETKTIIQWAEKLGTAPQTILGRLERWEDERRAVTAPLDTRGGSRRGQKLAAEVLTKDEITKILEACGTDPTGIRNRALIVTGWRSGLRISEALALRPKDLNEQERTIRVLHGKGDKSRTVGCDLQAWEVIAGWLAVRQAWPTTDESTLFCTGRGGRLDDRYVRALMPRLAKATGISKRVHFHGLRHTMAFELAGEGVPIHLIQKQLGHSNLAITSRYIDHLNPAETINKMKGRSWDARSNPDKPDSELVAQLKSICGDRLKQIIDSRTGDEWQVIIILA